MSTLCKFCSGHNVSKITTPTFRPWTMSWAVTCQSGTESVNPGFANAVPASVLRFVLVGKYQWSTRFLKYARGYMKGRGNNCMRSVPSLPSGSHPWEVTNCWTHVDMIHWLAFGDGDSEWAIERSGFRFLWALPTQPSAKGLPQILKKFCRNWGGAPQRAVLANKAVGGLCGWNSILMFGIPIATWPIYA